MDPEFAADLARIAAIDDADKMEKRLDDAGADSRGIDMETHTIITRRLKAGK